VKEIAPRTFTDQPGLFKIELTPVRVSRIPGLTAFDSIDRFAISQSEDAIVFGGAKGNYPAHNCGVYKLDLSTGDVRAVIDTSDCKAGWPWRVLSMSPSGTDALITADHRLALLDLSQGSIRKLGDQLSDGSFSPDGNWIAALQLGDPKAPSKTILIDRSDLTHRRDLGGSEDSEVVWSPDSRFLLHTVYRPACPSHSPLALETLDIQTGKRSLIKDSICNCSSHELGWVGSDIKR
jgi:hypothetical protein